MKRDMDMVRELLLEITDDVLRPNPWDDGVIYHLKMLSEIGFIEGIAFLQTFDGWHAAPSDPQLTWRGHEFLETIREKSVWDKVKSVAKEKGVGLTIESITKIASAVVASILK
jgi:hypothetical protein